MSLRHKLVLLLSGLTLAAVSIAVAVAYQEVRLSSRVAANERLGRVSDELAELVRASMESRAVLEEQVAGHPVVWAALEGRPVDTVRLAGVLDELRTATDSALPIHIVDAGGRSVHVDSPGEDALPDAGLPLDSVSRPGLLHDGSGGVLYWSTFPLRADGEIAGWIAQERGIGGSGTAEQIEDLIGGGANIVLALPGEKLSVNLRGEGVTLPRFPVPVGSVMEYEREGEALLARASTLSGSPWIVVVETPAAAIQRRATAFLRTMSLLALVLILGTVLVAYALGRRLVGPIEELVAGAEALARGNYQDQVTTTRGGDELDRLARSFNEMASRVSATHEELEERLDEQRALTAELETITVRAEEARKDAERANQAKSDFLATMSHEVRTPINAILGYCDLLDLEIPDSLAESQREKVDRIRRSSRILGGLVEDVLDFAKMDSGKLRFDAEEVDVDEVVRDASAVIEPQAEEKGLPVRTSVEPGLRLVADRRRMEQILVNLLSNAVKFTDSGRVEIRASGSEEGPTSLPERASEDGGAGWVRIDVVDTGPGVPAEERERIFEPFVQSDSGFTRRHGGTGLGLSISRELARRMGGEVALEDHPEGGSAFTLWLPSADRVLEAGQAPAGAN